MDEPVDRKFMITPIIMSHFPAPAGMLRALPWLTYLADCMATWPGGEYAVVLTEADYLEAVADLPAVERILVQTTDTYQSHQVLVGHYTGIARLGDA